MQHLRNPGVHLKKSSRVVFGNKAEPDGGFDLRLEFCTGAEGDPYMIAVRTSSASVTFRHV
jgi:hypothetical protein